MSRIYVDTSAWISAYAGEVDGVRVLDWLDTRGANELLISDWVVTEYASGLSMKKRRGELTLASFQQSHKHFDVMAQKIIHLPIESVDYAKAAALCRDANSNLRASDALHLALAIRHKCTDILSLDHVLNAQAKRQGIRVIDL